MFLLAYALAVAGASVPLIFAIVRACKDYVTPQHHHDMWHASRWLIGTVFGLYLLEGWIFPVAADSLWFSELHQSARYWTVLGYQAGIFVVAWLVIFLFVGYNLWLMTETPEVTHIPPKAGWWVAFLVALVGAGLSVGFWQDVTAYLGSRPNGTVDAVFGYDISFYLFSLPLYQNLVDSLLSLVLLLVVVWIAVTALYNQYAPLRRDSDYDDERREVGKGHTASLAAEIWNRWAAQGSALFGLALILYSLQWALARYGLVVTGSSAVVPGASYMDVAWKMPVYAVAGWVCFGLGVLCLFAAANGSCRTALVRGFRGGTFKGAIPVIGTLVLAAGFHFCIWVVPAFVHHFYVQSNEITLELPYLKKGIAGTREAFNLTSKTVAERTFNVSPAPLTSDDLAKHVGILRDARIWDWGALQKQLQQDQSLRTYYRFDGIGIDRYQVDGTERQVMLSAREMDVTQLSSQSQVWVNKRIKYTHGYGIAAVPVNEHDASGNPVLWSRDIPVTARDSLTVQRPQIYFGVRTTNAVYVDTKEPEFDYPKGDANAESVYEGSGGILLSGFWRKLVFAHELDGSYLFSSDYFKPGSKVLWRREIRERIKTLAPFLTLDRDPYVVAGGDHYYWLSDAYTTSQSYPYSEPYKGTLAGFQNVNYMRNSVKAVLDGYDGSVTFYVFDLNDPIIAAYRRMLPGLFKDASEMPELLRQHVRYPEDLFTVQAETFQRFHMTDPMTFFNGEDQWDTPKELYYGREQQMMPYYVMTELPESRQPEFMIMLPFAVHNKTQMAGWFAGLCDRDNYGKLVAYTFPKGVLIDGPAQIESRISSKDEWSSNFTLWNQQGSKVIRGNLLILPIGNSLIMFEPIYIEAEETKIPQLTRVVFGQLMPNDRHIVWASTLSDAEGVLVGALTEHVTQPSFASTTPDSLVEHVRQIIGEMNKASASRDYATFGKKFDELQAAVNGK
jgi:uncharacterized membrane protein (UPF0182 family)